MFLKKISRATTTFTQIWQVRNLWVLLVGAFLMMACDDPEEIGTELFGQDIGLAYTDTLTVDASTIQLDSMQTSGIPSVFVGSMSHPVFGDYTAKTFFQVTNIDTIKIDTAGTSAYKASLVESVDSLALYLVFRRVAGDTNKTQTFKVHRVKSSATPTVSKVYNTGDVLPDYDATPLATVTRSPLHPIRNATSTSEDTSKYSYVKVPLPMSLAKEIFAQRNLSSANAVVYDKFKDIIKGLVLVSESSQNAALSYFSVGQSMMDLSYHYTYTYRKTTGVDTTVSVNKTTSFYLSNGTAATGEQNVRWTNVTVNRKGALANLKKPADALKSTDAGGYVYMDNISGLAVKLKFPTLLNLKNNKNVAINKAELILEPDQPLSGFTRISNLVAIQENGANRPLRYTSTNGFVYANSETQISSYATKANSYTFNVTSALQNILSGKATANGWILTPTWIGLTSSTSTSVSVLSSSRIVAVEPVQAVFNAKNIKLKVYYTHISK